MTTAHEKTQLDDNVRFIALQYNDPPTKESQIVVPLNVNNDIQSNLKIPTNSTSWLFVTCIVQQQ